MNRLHIHINVTDLQQNILFYNSILGSEPTVIKDDYAKWYLEDPKVNFAISARGAKTGLDHLGIQTETDDGLQVIQTQLSDAGAAIEAQKGTTCCYAESDKYWTIDPQGIAWEAFHTLADSPTFNVGETSDDNSCCRPEPDESSSCCG